MPKRHFEDFSVGDVYPLPERRVGRPEIIAFAAEFDPQPFHLDERTPATDLTGGLLASGWHVCAVFMRMLCDGLLLESATPRLAGHRDPQMAASGPPRRSAAWAVFRDRNALVAEPPRRRHRPLPPRGVQPGRRGRHVDGQRDLLRDPRDAPADDLRTDRDRRHAGARRASFHRRGNQALRRRLRPAALPSRRGEAPAPRFSAGSVPAAGTPPR